MQRFRLLLLSLLALVALAAGTSIPASAEARSSIKVGIGDQSTTMFDHQAYKALGLKQTRYFLPWNSMDDGYRLSAATQFVEKARANGVSVLLHISTDNFEVKKAKLPSVKAYTAAMKRLVPYFKSRGVTEFGVWNEANHASQPTYKNPKRAAQFFTAMYPVVMTGCSNCKIVALDVLDQGGVDRYQQRFYKALSPTYRKRAKIIGLHNYSDVNRGRSTFTSKMIKASRHYNRGTKFWFTETGGLVEFGKSFKCSTARASKTTKNVFSLAKRYKSQGVERIYLYNWNGAGCGTSRQDAGLVDPHGKLRPAYKTLKSQLKGYSR